MNRKAKRALLLVISLLVGCIAFCGTVSAATIQSPSG